MSRLTSAQRRGLLLLARPGAEAVTARSIRWSVVAKGQVIGTIHSESLMALRDLGLVEMFFDGRALFVRGQRITSVGERVAASWEAS